VVLRRGGEEKTFSKLAAASRVIGSAVISLMTSALRVNVVHPLQKQREGGREGERERGREGERKREE
jgi:hypothetical protein